MDEKYLTTLIWIKGYLEGLQNLKKIPNSKIENLIYEINCKLFLELDKIEKINDDLHF